jgi:arylsulfatase A-like enzyme
MMLKYARCVAGVDENVGRVLKYLDDQKLSEDTIVIYTSDQGYWLGQHGFYDKRLILDTSLKMPFVVRFPGRIKPGSLNENLCANVDLAPTLLDYAGIEFPKAMQGRSLRPLLEGTPADDWREALWYCYWGGAPNHWGVRTDRYTLVKFPGTDEIEFYDNEKDPDQTRNIAQEADYASSIRVCEAQLARLMKEVAILPAELPKKATSKHPAGPWTPEQGNPDDKKRPKRKPARK